MSRVSLLAGVCALLALSSSAARAQASGHRLGLTVATTPARLQRDQSLVGSARLGISQPRVSAAIASRDALAALRAASLRHRGPGVALMLVGAAGVVTGLLIDESLITILGAGTGLVGLYLYLR